MSLPNAWKWIVAHRAAGTWLLALAVFIAFCAMVQGCAIEDLVRTSLEPQIQRDMVAPRSVTLRQAESILEDWRAKKRAELERQQVSLAAFAEETNRIDQRQQESVDRQWGTVYALQSMTELGLAAGQGPASAFPGGAALIGLLGTGLGASFAGARKRKAAEAAREEGLEEGRETGDAQARAELMESVKRVIRSIDKAKVGTVVNERNEKVVSLNLATLSKIQDEAGVRALVESVR